MSYADQLMSTGEQIRYRERQHWFILLWAGRYAILAIIGGLLLVLLANAFGITGVIRDLAGYAFAILLIVGVLNFIWVALTFRSNEYVLTNRRVMQVGGVINKHSTDSSLEKINDAALSQSFFGRIFNFGDLDVLTASEAGIERFRMIHDPVQFKKTMLDVKHDYELEMSRGPVPSSPPLRAPAESTSEPVGDETSSVEVPPAPPPAPVTPAPVTPPPPEPSPTRMTADEVTRTLASLAQLRDSGAISPEDYEQKKADLLGRI
ncbi:MAG TPA: PH domain-containing protein [Candidatus Limnocylindrales bacterium]|nr:PH domain-containing protein [Candidatus Limnocylindrales bacterium]